MYLDIAIFLLKVFVCIFFPFFIPFAGFYLYYMKVKHIYPVGDGVKMYKQHFFLRRLFVDFPRRLALDKLTRNKDYFPGKGIHVFCGEQGSGKTIALVQYLLKLQAIYPKLYVKSNFGYKAENEPILDWRNIVNSNNGIYGEVDCIDEIQNWFNSLESKNFPPEMMSEVTQQRKQRKMILATAQVFMRIAKPIREQISFVYKPITLFGCLTVVRKYKPIVSSTGGELDSLKLRGMYFFVHTDEIRNAFDTYKKIERISTVGFKDEISQIRNADKIGILLEDSKN